MSALTLTGLLQMKLNDIFLLFFSFQISCENRDSGTSWNWKFPLHHQWLMHEDWDSHSLTLVGSTACGCVLEAPCRRRKHVCVFLFFFVYFCVFFLFFPIFFKLYWYFFVKCCPLSLWMILIYSELILGEWASPSLWECQEFEKGKTNRRGVCQCKNQECRLKSLTTPFEKPPGL